MSSNAETCNREINPSDDRLRFPRIIRRRLLAARHSHGGFGERHRAGAIGRAGADVGPANFAVAVHDIRYRRGDKTGPVSFVCRADSADQRRIGVHQQTQWIRIERNVRPVFLAVAGNPLTELSTLFGRLHADAEHLDLLRNVAL